MPSKRKHPGIDPTMKTTPPATQKPGKLKSILKRPTPSSRFLASTPSAQIKLEFHAATRTSPPAKRGADNAQPEVPKPAKKPKLEIKSEMNVPSSSMTLQQSPISNSNLDIIEDSAAEPDLPKPEPKKSNSPKYEDDGDTEDLITDSKPQSLCSDDTLLMSGGLGPGESPYKRAADTTKIKPSKLNNKKKKKKLSIKSATRPQKLQPQVKCEQIESLETKLERARVLATPAAQDMDTTLPTKQEAFHQVATNFSSSPPTLTQAQSTAVSKVEREATTSPLDIHSSKLACTAASVSQSKTDGTIPPSSKLSRLERRKAKRSQSPVLAGVTKILERYEETRKAEIETLQIQLQSAQTKAAHLETQLEMLQGEIASRSKERETQCSWQLNKYAIFSRRSYRLQDEEETRVIAGCDDLEEANGIARAVFQSEMNKLEAFVEDLGQAKSFAEMDPGMPQIQMRFTPCGMSKCRSYYTDSQWDLTVERVASA